MSADLRLNTIEIGDEFERDVRTLLGLIDNAQVDERVRIAGKEVDLVCTVRSPFGTTQRTAVECKNYTKRLSREVVSQIMSDYWSLLDQREIDQILLVTRSGIVANARAVFDGRRALHLSIGELTDHVLRPTRLLANMRSAFENDLQQYYVPSKVYKLDLSWASANYEILYSDFLSYSLQARLFNFEKARSEWRELTEGSPEYDQPNKYTSALFDKAVRVRSERDPVELEPLIDSWIDDSLQSPSIALIGSYGTGKSSFAKRLAFHSVERYVASETNRIPILMELRNFGGHQEIESFIIHELHQRHGLTQWTYDTFRRLNRAGNLLLILDGFDEMKQGLTHDALMYNFDQLSTLTPGRAKLVICGRPTAFSSDEEQIALMTGKTGAYTQAAARYTQLNLAPFAKDEVFGFLSDFLRSRTGEAGHSKQLGKLKKLQDLVERNEEVASLLERPVHLPMIAELLPSLSITAAAFRRARIYDGFISQAIKREVLRQKRQAPSYQNHSVFAEEVALLMLTQGESRSLRFSEIPDALVSGLAEPGQSLDECRRMYVTSSIIERKSPDILYFPHKSFTEFLAAKAIVRRVSMADPTNGLESAFTTEVISFLMDLSTKEMLGRVATDWSLHRRLLETLLAQHNSAIEQLLVEPTVARSIGDGVLQMSQLLCFYVLRTWLSRAKGGHQLSDATIQHVRTAALSIQSLATGTVAALATDVLAATSMAPATSSGSGSSKKTPASSSKITTKTPESSTRTPLSSTKPASSMKSRASLNNTPDSIPVKVPTGTQPSSSRFPASQQPRTNVCSNCFIEMPLVGNCPNCDE